MNHLSQSDQQFVPISTVDNIIEDIHKINSELRLLNPENPSTIRVPPRLADSQSLKRSQSVSGAQNREPVRKNSDQNEVALRLSQLHSKVDRFISKSRENSPVRTMNRNSSLNRLSTQGSRVTFADELVQKADEETEKKMYKTATSIDISSPVRGGETEKRGGDWSSLGRPVESATIKLNTFLKNSTKLDGSPVRNSYLNGSPSRGILKQQRSYLDRDSSPLSKSALSGSSPSTSPLKNSGNNFTSFVLSSTMGSTQTLYNKEKLNQIISGIKQRQALEGYGYGNSSMLTDSRAGLSPNKSYASYIDATRKPVSAKPGLIDKETPRF